MQDATPTDIITQAVLDHPHLADTIADMIAAFEKAHPSTKQQAAPVASSPPAGPIEGKACTWRGKSFDIAATDIHSLDRLLRIKGFTGVVTGSNGVEYHYVNGKRVASHHYDEHISGKADHSDPDKQLPSKEESKAALDKAVAEPHAMDHDAISALPDHLANLNMHELREIKKALAAKGNSGYKANLIEALHQHMAGVAGMSLHPANTSLLAASAPKVENPVAAPVVPTVPDAPVPAVPAEPEAIKQALQDYLKANSLNASGQWSEQHQRNLAAKLQEQLPGVTPKEVATALGHIENDEFDKFVGQTVARHTQAKPEVKPDEPPTKSPFPDRLFVENPAQVREVVQTALSLMGLDAAVVLADYKKATEVLVKIQKSIPVISGDWAQLDMGHIHEALKSIIAGPTAAAAPESTPSAAATGNADAHIPDSIDGLKHLGGLGGSTGAKLVQDADGNKFVLKSGASPDHVKEEHAADRAYEALGLSVPAGKIINTDKGPVKVAAYLEGAQTLGAYLAKADPAAAAAMRKQVSQGFVADALLGNWDVVGMSGDNVLVDKDGKAWRIDNGGSLRFRAQGALKTNGQWGPTVSEIDTLRDPYKNPRTADVFKDITSQEIADQVKDIVANKEALLAALPEHLRDMVGKRIDWLKKNHENVGGNPGTVKGSVYLGKGADWKSVPPAPHNVLKVPAAEHGHAIFRAYGPTDKRDAVPAGSYAPSFKTHMAAAVKSLTPGESNDVEDYTGDGYDELNAQMRNCPETLNCLGKDEKKMAANVAEAIAKGGTFDKPVTVWRNSGINSWDSTGKKFLTALQHAMSTGDEVRIPGFKSTTLNPRVGVGGGDVKLEIRAKSGLLVEGISLLKHEQELLQGHNCRYRVVSIKDAKDYPPQSWGIPATKIVQLEEI